MTSVNTLGVDDYYIVKLKEIYPYIIGVLAWTFILWWLLSPGVFAHDSMVSLHEGKIGVFTSNQPPMLGIIWNFFNLFGNGASWIIFLSVASLTAGMFLLFLRVFSAPLSAILVVAISIFPAIFTEIGIINKESISCNFILFSFAILCYLDVIEEKFWLQMAMVFLASFLLSLSIMVRYQYIVVVATLILFLFITYIIQGGYGRYRYYIRWLFFGFFGVAISLIMLVASISYVDNVDWRAPFTKNWRLQLEYDLASLIANGSPGLVKGVQSDLQVRPNLIFSVAKAEYTPATNVTLRRFNKLLKDTPTSKIEIAVTSLEAKEPWELLYHHAASYADLLGFGKVCWPVQINIPMPKPGSHNVLLAREIDLSKFKQSIASKFVFDSRFLPANTFLFRPISYIILFIITAGWLVFDRSRRNRFFWLFGMPISAFAYVASFAPVTPSCDFRYSYWLVISAMVFAAMVIPYYIAGKIGDSVIGRCLQGQLKAESATPQDSGGR